MVGRLSLVHRPAPHDDFDRLGAGRVLHYCTPVPADETADFFYKFRQFRTRVATAMVTVATSSDNKPVSAVAPAQFYFATTWKQKMGGSQSAVFYWISFEA